jgi:hypothetical protein
MGSFPPREASARPLLAEGDHTVKRVDVDACSPLTKNTVQNTVIAVKGFLVRSKN